MVTKMLETADQGLPHGTDGSPLSSIRQCLDKGLHQEGLRVLRERAMALAAQTERPVAAYVLASVFGDLETRWDGRAVPASQIDLAEKRLVPLLRDVIGAIERGDDRDALDMLQALVADFIRLQCEGTLR
jgi:hypothetical protein